MATTLLARTEHGSQGRNARPETLNAGIAGIAVSARNAAGGVSGAAAQSAVANAIASMAMPMNRANTGLMYRSLMHAAKVVRNLAAKVAANLAVKAATSAGQIAARVRTPLDKRALQPNRSMVLPTAPHHSVTRGLRLRDSMKATARLKPVPMQMGTRGAKSARVTAMAVTVARAATVRTVVIAQSAVSAKNLHPRTASSHWKVFRLMPEDQMVLRLR